MKKAANVLLWIFSYGVLLCLFAGALSFIGYLAALIIGGEQASVLCVWIHKTYFPLVIKATSIFTGCGLVGMYLNKAKALTLSPDKK